MVLATIDRVEEEVLIVLTHTDPVQTIHLPLSLFPDLEEWNIIEFSIEKNPKIVKELRDRVMRQRRD